MKIDLPDYLSEEQKKDIWLAIKNNVPIIITGKQGPVEKTYLTTLLRNNSIIAYEEWECLTVKLGEGN